MRHIATVVKKILVKDHKTGCGECVASCQSACKTSCTVGNQSCVNKDERINIKDKDQK
ncbi:MAG: six-cysteine peptide SCIFF [Clostridiales bacterium]|nr:six-cysteine peptide SCIFF [Clostridiales bacterium]